MYKDYYYNGKELNEYYHSLIEKNYKEAIKYTGMVCIRPDGYLQNKSNAVVKYLLDEGCIILDVRMIQFTQHKFEELYRNKTALFSPNIWVFDKIYTDNPCIILLFTKKDLAGYDSLSEYFDYIKGHSSPTLRNNGIREALGRLSSFHGLIHCSSDPLSLFREMLLFYTEQEIKQLLSAVSIQNMPANPSGRTVEILQCLLDYPLAAIYQYDVFSYTLYLIRRILSTFHLTIYHNTQFNNRELLLDKSGQLFDAYNSALLTIQKLDSFKEKSLFFTETADKNRALLEELHRGQNSFNAETKLDSSSIQNDYRNYYFYKLPSVIYLLCGYEGNNLVDMETLYSLLRNNSIYVNDWEKSIIAAGMRSDINRDSAWDGKQVYPKNN